jgi:Cu2+-exporting ATPase
MLTAPYAPSTSNDEVLIASRALGPGLRQTELSIPGIHCGACVTRIERLVGGLSGVERARVNLSTRRLTVDWRGEALPPFVAALDEAGYDANLRDAAADANDGVLSELVRALAVAGFAACNIMAL